METEKPTLINEARIRSLRAKEAQIIAQLTEVRLEIQRVEMGKKPQDLSPILRHPDIFWRRIINFDQTLKQQANQQSDAKL